MSLPDESVATLVIHASIRAGVVVKSLKWKQKGLLGKKETLSIETEDKTIRLDSAALETMTVEELSEKLQ